MAIRRVVWITTAVLVGACSRAVPRPQTDSEMRRIAADVVPRIEEQVGLTFREEPALAVRRRDQVARYLVAKLDEEYAPEAFQDIAAAYRLFGLVPDTVVLRTLLLDLLTEQVAGYYDPDSLTLYVVEGTDPVQIRLVLAHELVHALQGQYVPLDSVLATKGENDRRLAAQAVFEGQATLASLVAMLDPDQMARLSNFWRDMRQAIREQQQQMPEFAAAPRAIREELLFPYLAGADFLRWFTSAYPDTVPFGPRLPASTEQILHPDRYGAGDAPVTLRFLEGTGVAYEDTWGEFETRLILQELTGSESMASAGALGWDGDRFAVIHTAGGDAIVWWTLWDAAAAAEQFAGMLDRHWAERRGAAGRRSRVERTAVDGVPAVLLVDAPDDWPAWERGHAIPAVTIRP